MERGSVQRLIKVPVGVRKVTRGGRSVVVYLGKGNEWLNGKRVYVVLLVPADELEVKEVDETNEKRGW